MDVDHEQTGREGQRVQAEREELVERIARAVREDGVVEPLAGLFLARASRLSGSTACSSRLSA